MTGFYIKRNTGLKWVNHATISGACYHFIRSENTR